MGGYRSTTQLIGDDLATFLFKRMLNALILAKEGHLQRRKAAKSAFGDVVELRPSVAAPISARIIFGLEFRCRI